MLIWFVMLYLLVSIGIGLYAATRVHNVKDYVVAGRHLPLYVVTATVFATWFGAETVLGIPATFLGEGLGGIVSDPFGSSVCLILAGLFFATKLYRMNLISIGDYYRIRYNRPVEIITSIAIVLSYLGWVSAQLTALGLVFNIVSQGAISLQTGILIGAAIMIAYTAFGGMFSVVFTDAFHMIPLVLGLIYLAWLVSGMAGGVGGMLFNMRRPLASLHSGPSRRYRKSSPLSAPRSPSCSGRFRSRTCFSASLRPKPNASR